jgi:hypothetical protein
MLGSMRWILIYGMSGRRIGRLPRYIFCLDSSISGQSTHAQSLKRVGLRNIAKQACTYTAGNLVHSRWTNHPEVPCRSSVKSRCSTNDQRRQSIHTPAGQELENMQVSPAAPARSSCAPRWRSASPAPTRKMNGG